MNAFFKIQFLNDEIEAEVLEEVILLKTVTIVSNMKITFKVELPIIITTWNFVLLFHLDNRLKLLQKISGKLENFSDKSVED